MALVSFRWWVVTSSLSTWQPQEGGTQTTRLCPWKAGGGHPGDVGGQGGCTLTPVQGCSGMRSLARCQNTMLPS